MDTYSSTCNLVNPLGVYEKNYTQFFELLPQLREMSGEYRVQTTGGSQLALVVTPTGKYTHTITLTQVFGIDDSLIESPAMTVRLYHDVQVAEVIAFKHQSSFQAVYPYPNKNLRVPEKTRINRFLGEWLRCCLSIKPVYPVD